MGGAYGCCIGLIARDHIQQISYIPQIDGTAFALQAHAASSGKYNYYVCVCVCVVCVCVCMHACTCVCVCVCVCSGMDYGLSIWTMD